MNLPIGPQSMGKSTRMRASLSFNPGGGLEMSVPVWFARPVLNIPGERRVYQLPDKRSILAAAVESVIGSHFQLGAARRYPMSLDETPWGQQIADRLRATATYASFRTIRNKIVKEGWIFSDDPVIRVDSDSFMASVDYWVKGGALRG